LETWVTALKPILAEISRLQIADDRLAISGDKIADGWLGEP